MSTCFHYLMMSCFIRYFSHGNSTQPMSSSPPGVSPPGVVFDLPKPKNIFLTPPKNPWPPGVGPPGVGPPGVVPPGVTSWSTIYSGELFSFSFLASCLSFSFLSYSDCFSLPSFLSLSSGSFSFSFPSLFSLTSAFWSSTAFSSFLSSPGVLSASAALSPLRILLTEPATLSRSLSISTRTSRGRLLRTAG